MLWTKGITQFHAGRSKLLPYLHIKIAIVQAMIISPGERINSQAIPLSIAWE
jgi:hypothetical protein